jgi:uncharacterized protein involved in exopolysaccharide biosynthesis
MTNQDQVTEQEDEISLIDFVDFFIAHAITILMAGVLGLMMAGLYLWSTPPQYEAVAKVHMAQWPTSKILGVNAGNVEDTAILISRLSSSSTYSLQNIQACKMENVKIDQDLALTKKLKYSVIKASPNTIPSVVEIKVQEKSKDDAIACLKSVFETITATQNKIFEPLRLQATQLIEDKNKKLAVAKELLLRGDKSGQALSAVYLSTRDEIASLKEDIDNLSNFVNSKDSRSTRLISPIYAAEKQVSPKKSSSLIAGLFGGLCFGIVYVLLRKGITVFKKYQLEKLSL